MSNIKSVVLSKLATSDGHAEKSAYFDGWKAYERDPFHPEENPNGVIQMGLAENQLSFDLVQQWVVENPEASICTEDGVDKFRDIAIFQDYYGLTQFRNAIAKFMSRVRGGNVAFDPDRIVMSGGATGAHELISFCLADPGDAFLVPTPYYPGFDRDLCWRTGAQLYPVICDASNQFKLTREALEEAYNRAMESKIKVKGLVITNPSNPLGTVLDRHTLRDILDFINQKNIHLISDEIYAATVFTKPTFVSISEILLEDQKKCKWDPDLVHVIYSLSKDLGFPGFRVGIVYSYNDQVVSCGRKMSSFGLVSAQTQYLVGSMLSDDDFVDRFLKESSNRLGERHDGFAHGLAEVGIKCLDSNAGLFLWMNLSHLLRDATFEAEMELWRVIVKEVKLNVSAGSSFHCSEPGWFRVCIANMDDTTMEVALTRIRSFVVQTGGWTSEKKRCWNVGKLRMSFRRMDDLMMMSPHSPIASSPLVQART